MEKRIELEKRGRNSQDIRELNLDNCRSTTIVGLTDEFSNLRSLSLINVGLTSLKGFPVLPNLKKLELSDNRINNSLTLLETSPKIVSLNLSGNKIKDLDTLKPLQNFKFLRNLDLFNNEATSIENYREKIFKLIPSLKYLDGFDAEECEAEECEDGDSEEEVNGNGDDFEDSSDDDDTDDSVGLGAVYSENIDEMSDEEDYEAVEEEELDDEEEEEDEDADSPSKAAAAAQVKGKKRKHEDGESTENN